MQYIVHNIMYLQIFIHACMHKRESVCAYMHIMKSNISTRYKNCIKENGFELAYT